MVLGIKATPRRPNPNVPETETSGDVMEAPHDEDFGPMKRDDQTTTRTSDALMPQVSGPRDSSLRELKLTRRILEKFGYSDGCEGCLHAQAGLPHRGHSDVQSENLSRDWRRRERETRFRASAGEDGSPRWEEAYLWHGPTSIGIFKTSSSPAISCWVRGAVVGPR